MRHERLDTNAGRASAPDAKSTPAMQRGRMRLTLKAKAATAAVILILGITLIVAGVQSRVTRAGLLAEITAAQSTLVTRAALDLDHRLQTNLLSLTREAQAIPANIIADPVRFQAYLQGQPTMLLLFDGLFVFSPGGRIVAAAPTPAGRIGLDITGQEYYKRSVNTLQPLISRPFIGRVAHRPLIAMTAPIRDGDGRVVGFLAGFLDLLRPNFLGGLAGMSIGKSGHFFVITNDEPSIYVVNRNPELVMKSSIEAGAAAPNRRALSGFEGTIEDVDGHGIAGLFSYKRLKATDWILGTSYPSAEALSPIIAAEQRLWLVSLLLALLLAPAAWLLTSYAISPLYRLLQEARRLRKDSGVITDELTTRQDEIGSLARAFNALVVALQARSAELRTVSDAAPLGMFRFDAKGRRIYSNRTYKMITGLPAEADDGASVSETLHPDDRDRVLDEWRAALRAKAGYDSRHRYLHPDGRVVWASVKVAPVIVGGVVTGYVGSIDDITARREAQQELQNSEQRLRTITDTMPAWIAYIDRDEVYHFTNLAYDRAFGLSRDQMQGRTIREVVGEAGYETLRPFIAQVLRGKSVTFERERMLHGENRHIETTYIPEFDSVGNTVTGFHALLHDVTAKKIEEQRLIRLSEVDSLTGISNRVGLEQRLADSMAAARATGQQLAAMYIDIDYFKAVNSMHGHAAGDALLRGFAQRLKSAVRDSDTVARLGGDEFVVVLNRVDARVAKNLADKIMASITPPFDLGGGVTLSITASIGIALCSGLAKTGDQLLAEADAKLYEAKNAGRARFSIAE